MDPLASLAPWLFEHGIVSLAGAAFVERILPILPSYALLGAIGIAAADGYWSLPSAILLSALGGVLGCLPLYAFGLLLGRAQSLHLLERTGRLFGLSPARLHRWMSRFHARERSVAFGAQLVPTVRLLAPAIAGLLGARLGGFIIATALGTALWNALFIGVGYVAASATGNQSVASLALWTLLALLLTEALALMIWRLVSNRAKPQSAVDSPAVATAHASAVQQDDKDKALGDQLRFFRSWLAHPLRVAAVVPSSRALAELITSEISPASAPVIELGSGTGVFSRALIERGVPQDQLALIEYGAELAEPLTLRFPAAQVLAIDAEQIDKVDLFGGGRAGAVVSGLPLLSMSQRKVTAILAGAFGQLRPGGAFYQFTYGPRCPVPAAVLDSLGLEAERIGGTLANVPPASVYRISRRSVATNDGMQDEKAGTCDRERRYAAGGSPAPTLR